MHKNMKGITPQQLLEAHNAEAVKRIHERAGHLTDEVYEVPV